MKKNLYLGLLLFITVAVSTILLKTINDYAQPIIKANQERVLQETLELIYLNGETFEDKTSEYSLSIIEYESIDKIYVAKNDDVVVGYIYRSVKKGRNGNITTLVAIDPLTATIFDVEFINHQETPGRGSKINDVEFQSQIVNDDISDLTVDTISGATISSNSAIYMVKQALSHYNREVGDS